MPSCLPGRASPSAGALLDRSFFWLLAVLGAFLPLVVCRACRIWAPATTIQEAFVVYYNHLRIHQAGFHYWITGDFALLLFADPARRMSEWFGRHLSEFDRQQLFSFIYYAIQGTGMLVVFHRASRAGLPGYGKWLLLLVALACLFIEPFTVLGCYINYYKCWGILFPALALVLMRWFDGSLTPGPRTALYLGALLAVVAGTKYTMLAILGPFAVVVLLGGGARQTAARLGLFAAGFLATLVGLFVVSYRFRLDYLVEYARCTIQYAALPRQKAAFLSEELSRVLDPGSYYFGFQLLFVTWCLTSVAAGGVALRTRAPRLLLYAAAKPLALAAAVYLFVQRPTLSTIIDTIQILAFDAALQAFAVGRIVGVPRLAYGAAAVLGLVYLLSAWCGGYGSTLDRIAARSRLARQVQAVIDSHPNLPVVYYMDDAHYQPLLYPSPCFNCSWVPEVKRQYPREQPQSPRAGLAPFPQIAIVPEYLDVVGRMPYARVDVFANNPALADRFRGVECSTFQFEETRPRAHPIHLIHYRTRVTVAVFPPPRP